MAHNYDVGTRAWQPDPQEGWISSEVVDRKVQGGRVTLRFILANEEVDYLLKLFPGRTLKVMGSDKID